ncbi:helix-turn-helix domain-containing protein [Kibdelosporangium lantanae]|uniref:Helix-turn-helix domain-containing protein n=1 Tax=Kibdelosporangium lantanae TaxID=1497396 RepID=A0ABW3M3U7_9PSEU
MGQTPEPNYYGRKLIREIKSLRRRAGLTQNEAGERAHIELKKLSRVETVQLPSYHELCALLDTYGVVSTDWDPYLQLWEQAKRPPWWRKYHLKDPRYLRMEDEALTKHEFQLGYIPDLLQTEEYARASLTNTGVVRSEEMVDLEVTIRMRRQQRLFSEPVLTLHTLIHETALHQGLDREQLVQITVRAELPNVTVRIVPNSATIHEGLRGPVVLLTFPDEPDAAFTDSTIGLLETQDPEKVTVVRRTIATMESLAMTPAESHAYLTRLLSQPRR